MRPLNLIKKAISEGSSFVIATHINPEADAIGSQLAVYRLLQKLNKKAKPILDDEIPSNLKFFPDVVKIHILSRQKFAPANYEVLIVLDTPNPSRLGKIGDYLSRFKLVINIDHHISNTRFGDVVWVEENVSSAGEMVYKLYRTLGVEVDYITALYLYAAILTDSGCFRYPGTTPSTHKIVAELLNKGVEPYGMYAQIYEKNTVHKIRLWGNCLKNVQKKDKIVWVEITRQMLKESKARREDLEGVIDFLRTISDADVAVVFQELNSEVKVTFRSRNQDVDVNEIAKIFGGGGHKMASGCRVSGSIKEVRRKVFRVLRESMEKR
ncbi:MAG: hypothetical protein DRP73_05000 [Candidatus Omnitrophota bacterium]|nr:MAG: hypothetical protein DRP73_05000 [Candidatus Omnitrophota bacterium]